MVELTEEEKKLMETKSKDKKDKKLKQPFFYYWNKNQYLKTYTPKGYPDGRGLKTKDGLHNLKLPRWKMGLRKNRWFFPFVALAVAALILFLGFLVASSGKWTTNFDKFFKVWKDDNGNVIWNGPVNVIGAVVFAESIWFAFYFGFQLIFYFPYRRKMLRARSVIEIQTENLARNRKKYGTLSYENLLPQLGPKKAFNVTVLDDTTTLHDNLGWIIKCGITNDPNEISLARKGLLSKRMWEEKPADLIDKYLLAVGKNGGVPDKSYIYYIVSNSVDKLHCFSEGETGSGKTECYASPESIFILRHKSRPSVLFTCKAGDEKATVNQAKCLDIKIQHIDLGAPGTSDSFNPLYIPFLYHKLIRQLKYSVRPNPMNITPWDWENQYDIEIRQKDSKAINYIEDIYSKQQLLEELGKYTNDKNIEALMPNWKDNSITLQDMVNVYRSWENKKYVIVDIKKHFLMSNRLAYWTDAKKKSTTSWFRCGNWLFETLDEYTNNKDSLLSMVEAEFQSQVESVITNVMNEEKNTSTDAFWNNQVRLFLKMFIGTFFDLVELGDFSNNKITMSDAYFNLPTICTWLNNYCASVEKLKELIPFAQIIPSIEKNKSNMTPAETTFSSITGSINAITQFYSATSELLPIITRNDFNPLDFGLKQMLLCITTNNNEAATANVLLKDIVGQVTNCCNFICNNYHDASGKATMPRPIRIIADEAGSGAPIPWASINAIATKGRSQKILEGLYYQTIAQIQTQYPKQHGAEDTLFGNLSLQRCIKSKAEQSLKKWEGILGRGLATTLTDDDKKQELAGASTENPYFPAEYIRNKPQWNTLIKIGEMKTIDVSSCPLYPTEFKRQLAIDAKKHETAAYKKKTTTGASFWNNCYIDLEKVLSFLINKMDDTYNFAVQFNDLIEKTIEEDGESRRVLTSFGTRFSPKSQLQSYTSNLNNFLDWEKKYDEINMFNDLSASEQPAESSNSEDLFTN